MDETRLNLEQENKPQSDTKSPLTIGLLVIIVLLLVCNLSVTGYLAFKFQQNSNGEIASIKEPLPTELSTAQGRTELFEDFRVLYNNQDNENLYALFDPLACMEFSQEQLDQQLPLLYQLSGKINGGRYSYYEHSGYSNGRNWFDVYYRIQSENGIGTLAITIAQEGQEPYGIWGFNIFID